MDNNEATSRVMSRIQALDPEYACKIMGYILIQDPGEKEMIRMALAPETLLISLINQAKIHLGISSNSSSAASSPSPPSPFNPLSNPFRANPLMGSPRIVVPKNGFHLNPPSPSSPWSVSGFQNNTHMSPKQASSLSYAAVVNGPRNNPIPSTGSLSSPPNRSFSLPYDVNEEYNNNNMSLKDQVFFLDDTKNMDFMEGQGHHHNNPHRRSVSVGDVFVNGGQGDESNGGFGWRPCMYYAKGFCKNGDNCKFLHGGGFSGDSDDAFVDDGFDELLRMKAIQQPRFAAASQLMPGGAPFRYNRCMGPRSAAAALMMEEDFHKFSRCRPDRNDFAAMGFGGNSNSTARQIYLTFPADSTFKEEDVSNYFSTFGPVQDVRIPYQQKRMFGFVTFVFPETVKQILAKGNPHFVCESRVLVKPYKEKGKVPDRRQQMERGEFPACLSPSGIDPRDPYDLSFGGRVGYNTQEMILRRKLEEQAELDRAIECEGRRLMNFQLPDMASLRPNHHNLPPHLLGPVPIPSPTQAQLQFNRGLMFSPRGVNQEVPEGSNGGNFEGNESGNNRNEKNGSGNEKGESPDNGDSDLHGSLEHVLPDSLFASPTKSAADHHQSLFSTDSAGLDDGIPVTTTSASSNNIVVQKSCYFEMPRFSFGQEAIEM